MLGRGVFPRCNRSSRHYRVTLLRYRPYLSQQASWGAHWMTSPNPRTLLHPCPPSISMRSTPSKDVSSRFWHGPTPAKSLGFVYTARGSLVSVCPRAVSNLCHSADSLVDSTDYISHFTNLRHLIFVNLFLALPVGPRGRSVDGVNSFAWIVSVITALRSPITHLTIEVRVPEPAGLIAMDWGAIDVLLSSREVFRSLVQVSVVFLGQPQNIDWEGVVYPVTIRRLMPLTSMMGLLTFSTRGPKLSTAQPPPQATQHLVRFKSRRISGLHV